MRLNATRLGSIASSRSFGDQLDDLAGQVPNLDLNFAKNKSLIDDYTGQNLVTFTRASSATFVGSDGLIKTASTDVPRFDHNPTTGESLGLLVEEQRTNLLLRSEEFDNATEWATVRASISANATTSPSGTLTADKLVEDSTASNNHFTRPVTSSNVTSGVAYTFTVFAKAAERTQITIGFGTENSAFADSSGLFTLTGTGTAAAGGAATAATIQEVSNGWYRCRVSATATATAFAFIRLLLTSSGNTSYTGNGTSGLFLWGAQLEAGAFPTSYIPTTTATVTRSADVASITGSNFSSWYNQTEGTVFASGDFIALGANSFSRIIGFGGTNTGTDEISFHTRVAVGTGDGSIFGAVTVNSSLEGNLDGPPAYPNLSSAYRSTLAYKANDFGLSSNGLTPTTDTSGTLPTITQLIIMGSLRFQNRLSGHVRRLAYWPTRLANSTLQTVTQ